MPINVAQLNILVSADTSAAAANLQALQASFMQVAQAAAVGAAQQVGSEQQVIQAISAVVFAVRNQTTAIEQASQQQLAALDAIGNGARRNGEQINAFGVSGSRGLMLFNQTLSTTGQAAPAVTNGLYLLSSTMNIIPQSAGTAQRAMMLLAGAISAVGAASVAVGAQQVLADANLRNSLENSGKSWDDYSATVQTAIDKGAGYGFTQGEVEKALAQVAPKVKDQNELLLAFQDAADAAARRGISLATAMDIFVRAANGASRGLKVLNIDMQLIANVVPHAEAAVKSFGNALDALQKARDGYSSALQRYNDQQATASLKTDEVARATEHLARSQQSLNDLYARFAAEDIAPKVSHEAEAMTSLADAQQKLQDVMLKQAVANEQPTIDKLAEAQMRLAESTAHLNEVNQARIKAVSITPADLLALAAASDKVLEAQERMAAAQGGDIAASQNALNMAIDAQRKALDEAGQKHRDAIAQSSAVISAQDAVKRSAMELEKVQREAYLESIGQTPKQVEQAIQLRNAQDAVADAVTKVGQARMKDQSEQELKTLQRAREIQSAENQISDAVAGIAQAHNNAASAGIRHSESVNAVKRAYDNLIAAIHKAEEAHQKALAAQKAVTDQASEMFRHSHEVLQGAADADADTWAGMFRRIKADFLNFLGDFGQGAGQWSSLLFPVIWGLSKIRGLLAGGAAAEAGGEAIAGGGMAASLGTIAAAAAPVLAVAAAVGAVAFLIWDVHDKWDILYPKFVRGLEVIHDKFFETFDAIKDFAADRMNQIGRYITELPEHIGSGIDTLKSWGWNVLTGAYNGMVDFWNNDFYPWLSGMPGDIMGFFKDLPGNMLTIGGNIMSGLWNGLVGFYNDVSGPLGNLFHGLIDTGNYILGNHSPSKVFHEMGANVMQGLANGITATAPQARDALRRVTEDMARTQFKLGGVAGIGSDALSAAGVHGGGAPVVVNHYHANVQVDGSVIAENDLASKIRDVMVSQGRAQGGNYFGGYA